MSLSSGYQARRASNLAALQAFGVAADSQPDERVRVVRQGKGPTVFTVGYERRGGEDLLAALTDLGVELLIDVRDKPMSRKPDFRKRALEATCESAGVGYQSWIRLGSTSTQRDRLRESGDWSRFARDFRTHARRSMNDELDDLADIAQQRTIAMLCYERCHDECHRSVLADLLAEKIDATVLAIL